MAKVNMLTHHRRGKSHRKPRPQIVVEDVAARRENLRRKRLKQQLHIIESICKDLGNELPEFAVKMKAELAAEKVEEVAA